MEVADDIASAEVDEIVDLVVVGEETLHLPGQLEPFQPAFSAAFRIRSSDRRLELAGPTV